MTHATKPTREDDMHASETVKYEHAYEVTVTVIVHVPSAFRSRKHVTRADIENRLAEIVKDWDGDEAGSHIEGTVDYLESNVILSADVLDARAGLISDSDYFDADDLSPAEAPEGPEDGRTT